ncbi:MAG: hypothetical protein HC884_18155 [Chloroflexaceae bacterium]|nr:hypothetical protein [Chloroflexaceae bacterium]
MPRDCGMFRNACRRCWKRYTLVVRHYLAGSISLGRAAELLGIPWGKLRDRLFRIGVPIRAAPSDLAGAQADAEVARRWLVQPRTHEPEAARSAGQYGAHQFCAGSA